MLSFAQMVACMGFRSPRSLHVPYPSAIRLLFAASQGNPEKEEGTVEREGCFYSPLWLLVHPSA